MAATLAKPAPEATNTSGGFLSGLSGLGSALNPYAGIISGVAGALGGGGGPSSAAASQEVSSPFYNNAGINFNSDDSGINAGPTTQGSSPTAASTAQTPARQSTTGYNPQSDYSYLPNYSSPQNSDYSTYIIIAIGVAIAIVAFLMFKGKK